MKIKVINILGGILIFMAGNYMVAGDFNPTASFPLNKASVEIRQRYMTLPVLAARSTSSLPSSSSGENRSIEVPRAETLKNNP
ncbi:MAG TPA: hypothetical protein VJ201_00285 [Candidatus Babeliales bacterium]|nr:hypothetical protein [Candidatus Babeliales bacterium]